MTNRSLMFEGKLKNKEVGYESKFSFSNKASYKNKKAKYNSATPSYGSSGKINLNKTSKDKDKKFNPSKRTLNSLNKSNHSRDSSIILKRYLGEM